MIYAFDFDATLTEYTVQNFAIKLKKQKNEIWVVTMRSDNEFNNNIMKPVLDKIGLNKANVIFCNRKAKFEYLQAINADAYVDNISDEFEELKNYTSVIPLLYK